MATSDAGTFRGLSSVGMWFRTAVVVVPAAVVGLSGCESRPDAEAAFRQSTAPFQGASRLCLPFDEQPRFPFNWLNRVGAVTRSAGYHTVTARLHAFDAPPALVAESIEDYLKSMDYLPTGAPGGWYRRSDGEFVTLALHGVPPPDAPVSAVVDIEVSRAGRARESLRCDSPSRVRTSS